ncbi:MAG TPA: CHAT domain-containing protein [Longimicrobiaceae bacterium]|nr:CHAT domain-containing protein [Longimicrobiaceae bacterium]
MRDRNDPVGPAAGPGPSSSRKTPAPRGGDGQGASPPAFFAAASELLGDDDAPEAPAGPGFAAASGPAGDDDAPETPAASGFFAAPSELIGEDDEPNGPAAPASARTVSNPAAAPPIPAPAPTGPPDDALKVSVWHGNLSFARHPLAVGHYAGDTINGAEKRVDDQLDGRLSEKRQLGLYPGPIGSSVVYLYEDPELRGLYEDPELRGLYEDRELRGVVVVGLGDVGELTAARLERSFTQAVLAYASSVAERAGGAAGTVRDASLATLLIGSGRGGIGVEDSIRALLRGAIKAREALRASPLGRRVRIDRLEFVELYEDLAIRAAHLLRRLAGERRHVGEFSLDVGLSSGTGGRRRASFGEDEGWWDRVVVRSEKGRLVFQTPTQRAREETRTVPQQQRLVSHFIASAISDHGRDPTIPNALFELLLPNELKDYEPDRNDVVLVVDRETARFPWELLRNGTLDTELPMSVRQGLIRQFSTTQFRRSVSNPPSHGVLIIANPPTTRFKPLKGARREAEAVAGVFRAQRRKPEPELLVEATFDRIVAALFAEPWCILHLAAHGVVDHVSPEERARAEYERRPPVPVTGVVLADDVFLGPAEVEQIRHVPEIAFINCCHLGSIGLDSGGAPELAASLAEQLIRMGVRAVVCAGWAVEDEAAATFAQTFYEGMLRGDPFGRAVHQARLATFRKHRDVNTWGAYQCYGDHGYKLKGLGDTSFAAPSELDFTCANEAIADLDNLAGDAETTSWFGVMEIRRRLLALENAVLPRWAGDAASRAALAAAASKVGLLPRAILHYRDLARLDKARYTVEALEQLANLESRVAVVLWRRRRAKGRPVNTARLRKRMLDALARLEQLPGSETRSAERWSLIGSAHKRLSQLETPADRPARLEQMADSYRRAHEVALERRGRVYPYPTRNWLAARLMLHYLRGGLGTPGFAQWKAEEFEPWMKQTAASARRDDMDASSFWTVVDMADGTLIRLLADGRLPERVDEVLQGYRSAWQRGGSPLSLNSVTEHLDWMIDTLAPEPGAPPDAGRAALLDALQRIRHGVSALTAERRPGGAR